ncbi:MAG: flagellar hook-length control protein FliK [Candidatus Eisenbacteria bacterium]|nr:flagellar hook-length control protein FliK [Candidatus Eisenbacteria bacterium]
MIEIPLGGFWPSVLSATEARPLGDPSTPTLDGQEPQELTAEDAGLSLFATMLQSLTDSRPRLPEAPQGGAHDASMADTPQVMAGGTSGASNGAIPAVASAQTAAAAIGSLSAPLSEAPLPAGGGETASAPAPILLSSALLAGAEQHTIMHSKAGAAGSVAPMAVRAPASSPTHLSAPLPSGSAGVRIGRTTGVDAGSPPTGSPPQGPVARRSSEGRGVTAQESDVAAVARGESAGEAQQTFDLAVGTARELRGERAEAAPEASGPYPSVARSTGADDTAPPLPGSETIALASPSIRSDRSTSSTPGGSVIPEVATPRAGRADVAPVVQRSEPEGRSGGAEPTSETTLSRGPAAPRRELPPFAPAGPMITVSADWVLESAEPVAVVPTDAGPIGARSASAAPSAPTDSGSAPGAEDGAPVATPIRSETGSTRINLAALVRGRQDGLLLAAEAEARGLTLRLTDFLESSPTIPRTPETVAVIRVANVPNSVAAADPTGVDAPSRAGGAELSPPAQPGNPADEAAVAAARTPASPPAQAAQSVTAPAARGELTSIAAPSIEEAATSSSTLESPAESSAHPGSIVASAVSPATDGENGLIASAATAADLPGPPALAAKAVRAGQATDARPREPRPASGEKATGASRSFEATTPHAALVSNPAVEPVTTSERTLNTDQPALSSSPPRAEGTGRVEPRPSGDEPRPDSAPRVGAVEVRGELTSSVSESESAAVAPRPEVNTRTSRPARAQATIVPRVEPREPAPNQQVVRSVAQGPDRGSSAPTPVPPQVAPASDANGTPDAQNRGGLSASAAAGSSSSTPASEPQATSAAPVLRTRGEGRGASVPVARSASNPPVVTSDQAAVRGPQPVVAGDAAPTGQVETAPSRPNPRRDETAAGSVPPAAGVPRATTVARTSLQPSSAAETPLMDGTTRQVERGERRVVRPSDPMPAEGGTISETEPVSGGRAKAATGDAVGATPMAEAHPATGAPRTIEVRSNEPSKLRAANTAGPGTSAADREPAASGPRKHEGAAASPSHSGTAARSNESAAVPSLIGGPPTSTALGAPTPPSGPSPAMSEPRVTLPELGARLPEVVQVALSEGRREARIHLHPPELGAIDVRLQLEGDRVSAALSAEREEVRALLIGLESELRDGLEKAGLKLERLDVAAAASRPQVSFDPAVVSAPNAPQSATTATAGDARGQGFDGRGGQPSGERGERAPHAEPRHPRPEMVRRSAAGVDIRV